MNNIILSFICGFMLGGSNLVVAQQRSSGSGAVAGAGLIARVNYSSGKGQKRSQGAVEYNGVLYTRDIVLSIVEGAGTDAKNYQVYLNPSKRSKAAGTTELEKYQVQSVVHHPDYFKNPDHPNLAHNDIAVIKLDTEAEDCFRLILNDKDNLSTNTPLKLVGWNQASSQSSSYGRPLSMVDYSMVALGDDQCKNSYSEDERRVAVGKNAEGGDDGFAFVKIKPEDLFKYNVDPEVEVCGKASGAAARAYSEVNRGGALFKDAEAKHPTLIGIGSWGTCSKIGCKPGVFVRVSKLGSWIDDTVDALRKDYSN